MMELVAIYAVIAVLAFWPMSIAFPRHPAEALLHSIIWPWPLCVFVFMCFLLPGPFAVLKAIWSPVRKFHGWINRIEAARSIES